MNYNITRLDRRHAWHDEFDYMIEFAKRSFTLLQTAESPVLQFDRTRRWFNDQFGWSQDVTLRHSMSQTPDELNPHWAYSMKYDEYRVYVAGQTELGWFVLKHPQS